MNPELMERFLAKKAQKLGITVEELKARNASNSMSNSESTQTTQSSEIASVSAPSSDDQSPVINEPKVSENAYTPLQPQPEKVEVPSYVFGPAKMTEQPVQSTQQTVFQPTPQQAPQTSPTHHTLSSYPCH